MAFIGAVRSVDRRNDPDRIFEGTPDRSRLSKNALRLESKHSIQGYGWTTPRSYQRSKPGSISEVGAGDVPTEEFVPSLICRSSESGLERGVVVGVFNHPSSLPH